MLSNLNNEERENFISALTPFGSDSGWYFLVLPESPLNKSLYSYYSKSDKRKPLKINGKVLYIYEILVDVCEDTDECAGYGFWFVIRDRNKDVYESDYR